MLILMCSWLFVPNAMAHDGNLHQQIRALTKQIKKDRKNGSLYFRRGHLYRQHGEWKYALKDYRKAFRLDPSIERYHLAVAELYVDAEKLDSAMWHADAFLAQYPHQTEALLVRIAVYEARGNAEGMVEEYQQIIAHSQEKRPEYYISLSETILRIDSTNYADAIHWLEQGLQDKGFLILFHQKILTLELAQGHYDKALHRIDTILARLDRKEEWLVRKAQVFEQATQFKEAITTYRAAQAAIGELPLRHQHTSHIKTLSKEIQAALSKLETYDQH